MPHPPQKADHDHILRSADDPARRWLPSAAGCSREQQDWRSAEAADTSEAYAHFLEQHADSELANQARLRIAQLARGARLGTAPMASPPSRLTGSFWRSIPIGKWAEEARIRIEGFLARLGPAHGRRHRQTSAAKRTGVTRCSSPRAWRIAAPAHRPPPARPACRDGRGDAERCAAGTAAARKRGIAPLQRLPPATACSSEPLAARRVPIGSGNDCRVASARSWAGLAPRIVVASTSDGGQLYRLQAPASGEAQARALCDALKEQSQACVPVIPR